MVKRNTYRYELKDKQRIVYVGITDNLARRETEHEIEGKQFSKMNVVGPRVTRMTAEQWEEERLETYCKDHKGKPPKYNKTKK